MIEAEEIIMLLKDSISAEYDERDEFYNYGIEEAIGVVEHYFEKDRFISIIEENNKLKKIVEDLLS